MRLTNSDRDFLLKKVTDSVFDRFAKKNHDDLLNEVADKMLTIIADNYPEKDMKVLSKYGLASHSDVVEVGKDFYTIKSIKLPYKVFVPRNISTHSYHPYSIANSNLYNKVHASEESLKVSNVNAHQPYKDLIKGSTTWEQVVTVWKEAEQWMPKKGQALVAVSQATKSYIAQDSKTRKWA